MKKILSAGIAALMLCALAACGGNDASKPKPSEPSTPSTGEITITYDFNGAEEEAVQHSSYNVFDGVSILTSTGVELKTKATAASDCALNGKLLDKIILKLYQYQLSITDSF